MSIVAGRAFRWSSLSPSRPMHTAWSLMHNQIRAIHIPSIRHSIFLLRLMHIVLAAVIAHDTIIINTTGCICHTAGLALCLLTLINNTSIHTLIEWSSHIQTVLLVVYHTFGMCFAWSSQLVLVISTVATILIQDAAVLWTLIVGNWSHEVVVLGYYVVSAAWLLLDAAGLVSLARGGHCSILHAQGAVIVWALAALIHALHIFGDYVIFAGLGWMLIHLA